MCPLEKFVACRSIQNEVTLTALLRVQAGFKAFTELSCLSRRSGGTGSDSSCCAWDGGELSRALALGSKLNFSTFELGGSEDLLEVIQGQNVLVCQASSLGNTEKQARENAAYTIIH